MSQTSVWRSAQCVVKCWLWTAVSSEDPTMWEAEAGGQFVLNQPGVHGEILLNVCVIKDLD